MARLELARQSHTPLKRARIPIPPHPRSFMIIAQMAKFLKVVIWPLDGRKLKCPSLKLLSR